MQEEAGFFHSVYGIFEPPNHIVIGHQIQPYSASQQPIVCQWIACSVKFILGIACIAKGREVERYRDGIEFLGRDKWQIKYFGREQLPLQLCPCQAETLSVYHIIFIAADIVVAIPQGTLQKERLVGVGGRKPPIQTAFEIERLRQFPVFPDRPLEVGDVQTLLHKAQLLHHKGIVVALERIYLDVAIILLELVGDAEILLRSFAIQEIIMVETNHGIGNPIKLVIQKQGVRVVDSITFRHPCLCRIFFESLDVEILVISLFIVDDVVYYFVIVGISGPKTQAYLLLFVDVGDSVVQVVAMIVAVSQGQGEGFVPSSEIVPHQVAAINYAVEIFRQPPFVEVPFMNFENGNGPPIPSFLQQNDDVYVVGIGVVIIYFHRVEQGGVVHVFLAALQCFGQVYRIDGVAFLKSQLPQNDALLSDGIADDEQIIDLQYYLGRISLSE